MKNEDNLQRAIQTERLLGISVLSSEYWDFIKSLNIESFKDNLEKMINSAETIKDLYKIGAVLDYAIDNEMKINICDYQCKASRKMTEIYNKIEESEKYVA